MDVAPSPAPGTVDDPSTVPSPVRLDLPLPDPDTPIVVALDHPGLDHRLDGFVAALRTEGRRFGPTASVSPEPFPSLLAKFTDRGSRRIGVVVDGRVTGVAAVAADGEVAIAVAADRRGQGIGRRLLTAAVERAALDGFTRLHLLTSRRSKPVIALGTALGWTTVDVGAGRVELFIDLDRVRCTA